MGTTADEVPTQLMPTDSWKKTLYAVLAGELLCIAGFSTSGPILPFFLGDLGVSDPLQLKLYVGLIQSLPAISLAVMAPIWGSLADSYGRKPMLVGDTIAFSTQIVAKRTTSKPGVGLVRNRNLGVNQRGEVAIEFVSTVFSPIL